MLNLKPIVVVILLLSTFKTMADSVAEPLVSWKDSSVRVCWGSHEHLSDIDTEIDLKGEMTFGVSNWSFETKKTVKDIIEKNYVKKNVGIEFTKWDICPAVNSNSFKNEYDLVIFTAEPNLFSTIPWYFDQPTGLLGKAEIGEKGKFEKIQLQENYDTNEKKWYSIFMAKKYKRGFFEKKKTNKAFVFLRTMERNQNLLNTLKLTALHEFGHAAGLRHEHSRHEVTTDQFCNFLDDKRLGFIRPKEPMYDTAAIYTEYDPFSIMSYCYIFSISDKKYEHELNEIAQEYNRSIQFSLSEGDKKTLRCLYKLDTCEDLSIKYRKDKKN